MAFALLAASNSARANTQTVGVTVTHGWSSGAGTLADGDVLYAFLGMGDDPGTGWVDSLSAWTALTSTDQASSTGNDRSSGVLRKVITNAAAEPSNYTFRRSGNSATDNIAAIVVRVRGADTTTPEDATPTTNQGSNDFTPTGVNIVTATDGALVLTFHLASGAVGTFAGANVRTPGAPSGFNLEKSEVFDNSSNTFSIFLEVASKTAGAAGTVAIGAWTGSADDSASEYDVCTVAVRAAVTTPVITSIDTDDDTVDTRQNVTIVGTTFGASQGSGKVEVGDTANHGTATLVELPVDSWSDTAIQVDLEELSTGDPIGDTLTLPATVYLFVTDDADAVGAGFAFTLRQPGPTQLAAVNTPATLEVDTPYVLRFRVENTGGVGDTAFSLYAQNTTQATGWFKVTTSTSHVKAVAAAAFDTGDDVAETITGSGSFMSNNDAASETGSITLPAGFVAVGAINALFGVQVVSGDVDDEDALEFRVEQTDGTDLEAYTETAGATVSKAAAGSSGSGSGTTPAIIASGTAEAEAAAAGSINSTAATASGAAGTEVGRRRGWDGPSGHGSRLGWCRGRCCRVWHNRVGNSGRSRRSGSRRCW